MDGTTVAFDDRFLLGGNAPDQFIDLFFPQPVRQRCEFDEIGKQCCYRASFGACASALVAAVLPRFGQPLPLLDVAQKNETRMKQSVAV